MREYTVANILDLLETIGEDKVSFALSEFSCPRNAEIEEFIHNNAIDFAKKKMSITYFVFDEEGQIETFFTLTHKPSAVGDGLLSKTSQKKLSRHARFDAEIQAYSVSAFLIAQFGKNESARGNEHISGSQLMDFAISVLKNVQRQVGGGVVFLECEDKAGLLNFYQNEHNNFKIYGERFSDSDQGCHYTSYRFIEILHDKKLRQSMSRKGNCWDNAPQESFFGHMKDSVKDKLKEATGFVQIKEIVDDYQLRIRLLLQLQRKSRRSLGKNVDPTAGRERSQRTVRWTRGVWAALDRVPRITLICGSSPMLLPCLPDEGRVWSEPRITTNRVPKYQPSLFPWEHRK